MNITVVLCSVHVVVATIPDCGEYQQVGAIQISYHHTTDYGVVIFCLSKFWWLDI